MPDASAILVGGLVWVGLAFLAAGAWALFRLSQESARQAGEHERTDGRGGGQS